MKDFTQIDLEATRPDTNVNDTIAYCLNRLYADQTHTVGDEVVQGLSFEELIGTLLQARDLCNELKESDEEEYTGSYASALISLF
ncbi:MAG TPA: hypothetical protein VGL77_17675 [Armatimonadota bacterium]|jgi:hypothetical protein